MAFSTLVVKVTRGTKLAFTRVGLCFTHVVFYYDDVISKTPLWLLPKRPIKSSADDDPIIALDALLVT